MTGGPQPDLRRADHVRGVAARPRADRDGLHAQAHHRERTLDNAMDKVMLSLTNFASEMERAKQRTYDAMVRKARSGFVTGNRTYGYDNARCSHPTVGKTTSHARSTPTRRRSSGGSTSCAPPGSASRASPRSPTPSASSPRGITEPLGADRHPRDPPASALPRRDRLGQGAEGDARGREGAPASLLTCRATSGVGGAPAGDRPNPVAVSGPRV